MKYTFHSIGGLLLFAALICLRAPSTYAQNAAASDDPSLVLHYDFEQDFSGGSVPDLSGNTNTGWCMNATNWITATNGVFGTIAARFRYVGFLSNDVPHVYPFSQYIAVTNLTGFAYLTNGTISFWAKFATNNDFGMYVMDTGYNTTYARDPASASNSWTIGRLYTPYLSFIVYPPGGGASTVVSWPNDTVRSGGYTPDLSTTNFHLYTVSIDCPNNVAIAYYDGTPYMTNTIGLPWIRIYGCWSQRWLCIGAMAHDGTPQWGDDKYPNSAYFVGRLDDIRIYNRTLSSQQIQSLYLGEGTIAQPWNLAVRPNGFDSVVISWNGNSNTWYQVDSRPQLAFGAWTPLGDPFLSSGGSTFMTNVISAPSQFYRVRPLP